MYDPTTAVPEASHEGEKNRRMPLSGCNKRKRALLTNLRVLQVAGACQSE
jgi:hypothetical protein